MDKNKKTAKAKWLTSLKNFIQGKLNGLRGKLVLFIVMPVIITSLVAISAVAIYVPDTVNRIKKSEVTLQGESTLQRIENLIAEAEKLSQLFSTDSNIVYEIISENNTAVQYYAAIIANSSLNNSNQLIPENIAITNRGGSIMAMLEYSDTDGKYIPVSGQTGELLDSYEIVQALNGQTISNYENINNELLILKIGAPIKNSSVISNGDESEDENGEAMEEYESMDEDLEELDEEDETEFETSIIGAISLYYNITSNKFVDTIKGDKDIEVSVFLNGKRAATTIKDGEDERRIYQQDLEEKVWLQIKDTGENYISNVNLFGSSYIGNYVPLYSMNGNITGIMEVAVKKVNLTHLYLIITAVVLVITLATVMFILAIVNRTILKPISAIVKAANTLSEGDVNVELTATSSRDEIGQLTSAFLTMAENIKQQVELLTKFSDGDLTIEVVPKSERDLMGNNLKQMVETNNIIFSEIISSAEQVASGARQIADGSQVLSQGSTEQASAIEELSESISKIAAQTKMNAENANEANKLVNGILRNAEEGTQQMEKMLRAVQEISKASTEISKVIKVIDDIAFQTNILALNAAVEAARAGEYGKGFAVVAEEVRNLAAKSAMAARDTTQLIENSIAKAKEGEEIAKTTAEALNTIVKGVESTNGVISQIAEASNEQATSIAQVNQGVEQVSKVVQTNAATAEESAAASEEMSTQSAILKDMISNKFKLKKIDKKASAVADSAPGAGAGGDPAAVSPELDFQPGNADFGKY